jgi:glucosamine--fructose-6-phosphate aminotransferase (isomerizing)
MMNKGIFGFWNPTENTLERFKVLRDVLAKDHARLELGICTLQNEQIQYQYAYDVSKLLSDWQFNGGLGIAFFRPTPIGSPQNCVMPFFSIGHIAVAYLGVIDNLSERQERLISYGYRFYSKKNWAETLSYQFHNYLEICHLSPVDAMRVMMKKLKGNFALMALIEEGKWLMVGCRDYPLAMGRNRNGTVYFGTEPSTLTQFSPSISSVGGNPKPDIFCATPSQSEILTPDIF